MIDRNTPCTVWIGKGGYYGYLTAVHSVHGVLNFARVFTKRSALERHVLSYYPNATIKADLPTAAA